MPCATAWAVAAIRKSCHCNIPWSDKQESSWLEKTVLCFRVPTWKNNEGQAYNIYFLLEVMELSRSTVWMLWDPLFLDSFPTSSPFYLPKLTVMKWPLFAHSCIDVPPFPFVTAALNVAPSCSACVGWHFWAWCYWGSNISEHAIQFLKAVFWETEGKIHI